MILFVHTTRYSTTVQDWDKHIGVFWHKRWWLPSMAFSSLIVHKVMSVYYSLLNVDNSLKDLCQVGPCYLLDMY